MLPPLVISTTVIRIKLYKKKHILSTYFLANIFINTFLWKCFERFFQGSSVNILWVEVFYVQHKQSTDICQLFVCWFLSWQHIVVKHWQVSLQICHLEDFVIWRVSSTQYSGQTWEKALQCSLPNHFWIVMHCACATTCQQLCQIPIWIRGELFNEIDHG